MIDRVRESVVGIIVEVDRVNPQSAIPTTPAFRCFVNGECVVGTGFFVNDKGDVVTASHVADDVKRLLELLQASNIKAYPLLELDTPNVEGEHFKNKLGHLLFDVQVQAEDPAHDIAILSPTKPNLFQTARRPVWEVDGKKMPANNPSAVTFETNRPRDGDDVFACGYPLGAQDLVTTSGHVATAWASEVPSQARANGLSDSVEVYYLDVTASPGNSGSPAFLAKNQNVLGIIVEVRGNGIGGSTAVVIPSHYITAMLDSNQIPWNSSARK
jgi:hypothetical protein